MSFVFLLPCVLSSPLFVLVFCVVVVVVVVVEVVVVVVVVMLLGALVVAKVRAAVVGLISPQGHNLRSLPKTGFCACHTAK